MERGSDPWQPSPTALTVLCIVGFSVSAGVLILLVPTLFRSDPQVHPLVIVGLVTLCAGFAVGARYWRPQAPDPNPS